MTNPITLKHTLLSACFLILTACSNGNKSEQAGNETSEIDPETQLQSPVGEKFAKLGSTPTAEETNYLTKAYAHIASVRSVYGISQPQSQLAFVKLVKEPGFSHVYLQQVYHSVPVFQNQMIVHFDNDDEVYRVTGSGLSVPKGTVVKPVLSENDITSAAIDVMSVSGNWEVKQSQLVLYCKDDDAYLAYQVELNSGLQRQFVLINALDGRLIKRLQGSPTRL